MSRGRAAGCLVVLIASAWACGSLTGAPDDEPVPPPPLARPKDDADICDPPTCGGDGGACGEVQKCGTSIHCGDCPAPEKCDRGTCTCPPPPDCAQLGASCGTFPSACGASIECGTCDGGSCQQIDGGFTCVAGPCVRDPESKTCAHACSLVNDNCTQLTNCGLCRDGKLCGGGAKPTACDCPPRQAVLYQFVTANNQYHCYGIAEPQCPASQGWTIQGPIATVYENYYGGELVPLYRCAASLGTQLVFLLTVTTNCDGNPSFVNQGPLGAVQNGNTGGKCGAVPLFRFVNGATNDYMASLSPAPLAGYSPIGAELSAWGN